MPHALPFLQLQGTLLFLLRPQRRGSVLPRHISLCALDVAPNFLTPVLTPAVPRHLAHLLPAIGGRCDDPAPHYTPPPGANVGQRRAVQLHGPRHLHDVDPLVATALGRLGPLEHLLTPRLQDAIIYALMNVATLKGVVDVIGPGRPPVHQQLLNVPVAVLGPKLFGANLTGDELRLNKFAHKIAVLVQRQLGGQGHAHPRG